MPLPVRRLGVLVLLCVAPSTMAQVQVQLPERPPPTNSFIMGQAVDAAGHPVGGAVVTLSGGLAQISLTPQARELDGGPFRALTDAEGRFVFSDLAAGSYTLIATKPGYLAGAYGRRRHGGLQQSLVLAEGERNTTIRIPMWEFVAIGGTVLDEAGDPMVGIMVTAHLQTFIATRSRLTPASTVTTDDRGRYRIDGLAPGSYVVCVPTTHVSIPIAAADMYQQARSGGSGAVPIDPPIDLRRLMISADLGLGRPGGLAGRRAGDVLVPNGARMPPLLPESGTRPAAYTVGCFQDANPADAQRLTLESGAERDNIDITLRPVPTATVSGTLVDDNGDVQNVSVRLLPPYVSTLASDFAAETAVALTDGKGAFVFPAVPLGQYTLKVLRTPPDTGPANPSTAPSHSDKSTGWAEMPITVGDEGLANLTVPLRGGFRLTGRLELDGTSPKPGPELIERFSIELTAADGTSFRIAPGTQGAIDRDGRITTNEIPPGRYVVLFRAFAEDRMKMPGWETVGATIDGRDVSSQPFDLTRDVNTLVMTLSDHAAQIAGTVRDSRGQADPGAALILFPADRARWTGRGFSQRGMRLVRASQDGSYRFGSVPPGDYFVAAVPDEDAGDWENPDVLTAAMRIGTRLSITRNEKKSLDVVTTPLRMGGR